MTPSCLIGTNGAPTDMIIRSTSAYTSASPLGAVGRHLDLDLADRLRVEACVAELLQQPVPIRDPRCLDRNVLRHGAGL